VKKPAPRAAKRKPSPAPKAARPKRKAAQATKGPRAVKAPAAKKTRAPAERVAPRADFGAPVDGWFTKQPPALRPITDGLRKLVDGAAKGGSSSLKWGMPFYELGGNMMCAIAAFKAHVNLILPGPPGTYADPDGLLDGGSSLGKHLKLRSIDDLREKTIKGWLRTAAARAKRG
jgi:hypothetical protein